MPAPSDLLPLIGYVLVQSTALVGLAGVSYIVGRHLTRRLEYGSPSAELAFSVAVGMGALATLLLGLGLVGLLYPGSVGALIVTLQVLCHRTWRDLIRRCRDADWSVLARPSAWMAVALGSLAFLLVCLGALYPPTGFDATLYHLPQAQAFVDSHTISFTPELRYPVFPHLQDVLFASVMLFWDHAATSLVQILCMLLVALTLYAWGLEFFSRRAGLWAAALWLGNPLVLRFSSEAYVDVGLAAFVTVAGFAFALWMRNRETGWLVLSAALCGFAAATKYHGLFFVALFGLVSFITYARQRQYKLAGIFWLGALIVALPWFARIYYYTGNPIFPFYSTVFGFSEWSMDLARMPYAAGIEAVAASGSGSWWSLPSLLEQRALRLVSLQLETLLTLPWQVTLHPESFSGPAIPLSPAYLLTLSLVLVALARSTHVRLLMAVVGIYGLGWFITVQDLRYLLCALGFWSLATAGAIQVIAPMEGGVSSRVRSGVTALLCLLFLLPGIRYGRAWLDARGPLPLTAVEEETYLQRVLPGTYRAVAFLNQEYGDRYRVYAINSAELAYFAQGELLGDWFGPFRYSRLSKWLKIWRLESIDPQEAILARGFYDELRSMDVGFFMAPQCETEGLFKFELDDFFHRKFELVFTQQVHADEVCLWEVRSGA